MTKMRWAAMGFMLLGACVVQGFGCSSSPAPVASGGACCACTVSDPATGCSNSRTLSAGAGVTVTDCASFCLDKKLSLPTCPNAAVQMVGGTGVACPGNLAEGGVTTGAGGSSGLPSEGGPIGGGNLGARCASNAECTGGLTCMKSSDDLVTGTPGGFPNGICTADCTMDTSVCGSTGALCVGFDPDPNALNPKAICLEECTVGSPAQGQAKCHNRPDEACDSVSATRNACLPFCTTDADCGTRKCSAGGVCTDTAKMGLPLGSPCMTDMDKTCAGGLCLSIESGVPNGPPVHGICSAFCVFGAQEACDWRRTPANAGPPIGACLSPIDMNGGAGDIGFCFVLCDADTDCPKTPGFTWFCDHAITGIDMAFNHGVCQIPDPDAGAPPRADAGGQ